MMIYTYSKQVNLEKLTEEILASAILKELKGITSHDGYCFIEFDDALDATEELDLGNIVTAHSGQPPAKAAIVDMMRGIMKFSNEMFLDFVSDNIMMGITQAGKTKAVADYLINVERYARSGSLYEVVNEIDALILAGVPAELSPYVTEARLLSLKQQVLDYLT